MEKEYKREHKKGKKIKENKELVLVKRLNFEEELKTRKGLKAQFTFIDVKVKEICIGGMYLGRLGWFVGIWYKGKVLVTEVGGREPSSSWRELGREVGHHNEEVKKWFELAMKYPTLEKYLPIAEKKASEWAEKQLESHKPAITTEEGEPQEIRLELETLQCMVKSYPTKDRLFGDKCKISCPRKALCSQIATILQESPILIKERSNIEKEGVKV